LILDGLVVLVDDGLTVDGFEVMDGIDVGRTDDDTDGAVD